LTCLLSSSSSGERAVGSGLVAVLKGIQGGWARMNSPESHGNVLGGPKEALGSLAGNDKGFLLFFLLELRRTIAIFSFCLLLLDTP
jgi:hypothetical protein